MEEQWRDEELKHDGDGEIQRNVGMTDGEMLSGRMRRDGVLKGHRNGVM